MSRTAAIGLLLALFVLVAFGMTVLRLVKVADLAKDAELSARHQRRDCERHVQAVMRRDCKRALPLPAWSPG